MTIILCRIRNVQRIVPCRRKVEMSPARKVEMSPPPAAWRRRLAMIMIRVLDIAMYRALKVLWHPSFQFAPSLSEVSRHTIRRPASAA